MMAVAFSPSPDLLTFDSRVSAAAVRVYLAVRSFCNRRTGQCNPRQGVIARKLGMCLRLVQKAIRELRLAGWITVKRAHWGAHYQCRDRAIPAPACGDVTAPACGDVTAPACGNEPPYLFNEPDVSLNQKSGAAAAALPGTAAAGGSAVADQTAKTNAPLRPAAAQLVEDLMPAHPEPGAPDRAIAEALKILELEPEAGEVIRRNHGAWLTHWSSLDPHRFIPQLWRWLASGEWKYAPIDRKGVRRETLIERKDREQREHDERSYRMYAELGLWDALREYGQDPEEWRAKVQSVA